MNYAHDAGYLYIEASRESGFNMGNVAKLACQTYLACVLRKKNGVDNEELGTIRYFSRCFLNRLL
jgi:hypothetical protein